MFQQFQYYRIKSEARKKYARKEYLKAFNKGETWPDPLDYKKYKQRVAMTLINLDWNSRVPKLKFQMKKENLEVAQKPPAHGGEAKPASGGHGAEAKAPSGGH